MPEIALPAHAYVPGRTPRHPDAAFAEFRHSVADTMTPDQLQASRAWRAGLLFLDRGFYWEAHEVLEPVWMATPRDSAEHQMVQGVIQIANAALKDRMDRPAAARRLCTRARDHLRAARSAGGETVMGERIGDMIHRIESLEARLNASARYAI